MPRASKRSLWVIKAGSQMVIEGGAPLIRSWMRQTEILNKKFGIDVIWVTSGAIATARLRTHGALGKSKAIRLGEKQALSAVGQPMVMDLYNVALRRLGRVGSQVLLTADDLANRKRRGNLVRTLQTLIAWNVLPILNENDAVSTEEIQFGDNDRLSALVAGHMKAERLVLLTDVEGLYDKDPKKNSHAKLIPHVRSISNQLLASLTGASTSVAGTGGMLSKLLAARTARRHQIVTHLVLGNKKDALLLLARGHAPGTQIGDTK